MNIRTWNQLLALGIVVASTGCATINVHSDPMAREAGVEGGARVILYGSKATIDNLKIYRDDAQVPLKIVMVNNPTFKQAVGNSAAMVSAEMRAEGQAASTGYGSASYTTTTRFSPAVFLKQKGTHTLRLVRSDGAEAKIVTKPHVGMRYVIIDWLLVAPTFFASIGIDWATGKWNMYDNIEIDKYFPTPLRAQVGTK